MWDIWIATCSRCVRFVGDNKAPETRPFSMEFVPKGEPEGYEWRGCERGNLHPLQMGARVCSLLQKDRFWFSAWGLGSRTVVWGELVAKPPVDASLNKLIVNVQYIVSCNVSKCSVDKPSNYPAHSCTSLRLRHMWASSCAKCRRHLTGRQ
jgi:hypothetical protein